MECADAAKGGGENFLESYSDSLWKQNRPCTTIGFGINDSFETLWLAGMVGIMRWLSSMLTNAL